MSAAAAAARVPVTGARARPALPRRGAERLLKPSRPTLDERISGVWERLVEEGATDCPVCGSELVAGHECGGCGSELS